MEVLTQNFPWLAGIGGIITVFWSHVQNIFFQLRSLILLEYEFTEIDQDTLYGILNTVCSKKITLHSSYISNYYVIDNKTKLNNIFFYSRKPAIFFYNKFPIFNKQNKIIYVRGTIPSNIINRIEEEMSKLRNEPTSNFRILDIYGKLNDKIQVNSNQDITSKSPEIVKSSGPINTLKFINFLTVKNEKVMSMLKQDNISYLDVYNDDIIKKHKMLKHWKNNKEWFKSRNIPWNRAIRIEGPPGTGKSTLIHNMAIDLGIPIVKFHLSTMDNKDFTESWKDLRYNSPCIVLFEDFDRLFNDKKEFILEKLTLDCILNSISGVSEVDGVLTIVTANFPEKLDSAMGEIVDGKSTRPGRLDFVMTVNELSEKGRRIIANNILDTFPSLIENTVKEGEGETASQFSQRCIELAQNKFYEDMEKLYV